MKIYESKLNVRDIVTHLLLVFIAWELSVIIGLLR